MLFATAELKRSWARFGLLMLGAGLLVFVLLFQQTLLNSVLDGMTGAVTRQSAPVLVLSREAQRSVAGSVVTAEQMQLVNQAEGVNDAAELGFTFLSFRPEGSDERYNASVIGYQPGRPGTPIGLRSGRLPSRANEVVASGEDASGRYYIGSTVTIEPGDVELEVVGFTEGGRMGISPTLWTPWQTYQELVRNAIPDIAEVLASVVAVQPTSGSSPGQVVQAINGQVPDLEAMTREDAASKAPGRDAVQLGFLLVMGLSYLVVAVVVGFFFLTMTLHKESAITTLRAIGVRGSYLVRCLLWQVAVVTFGGLAIGAALLFAVVPMLRSTLVLSVDPAGLAMASVPALAVALLSSLPAMRRVLRADASQVFNRPNLGATG